jgi:hypothetical protein
MQVLVKYFIHTSQQFALPAGSHFTRGVKPKPKCVLLGKAHLGKPRLRLAWGATVPGYGSRKTQINGVNSSWTPRMHSALGVELR